jgi:hypothetical protein
VLELVQRAIRGANIDLDAMGRGVLTASVSGGRDDKQRTQADRGHRRVTLEDGANARMGEPDSHFLSFHIDKHGLGDPSVAVVL